MMAHRGSSNRWGRAWIAAGVIAAVTLAGTAGETKPKYTWQKTETSLALLHGGRAVWEHHHDKATGKPHMKVCLLDGTELTRPWPKPDGYKGYDHTWHKALWWSWKFINGTNFWEGHHMGTEPMKVVATAKNDHSARIEADIHYHLPGAEPVLSEKRIITISPPSDEGRYHIDWCATFTAGGKDVTLNKNWYGGLAARMAKRTSRWTFRDSENRKGAKACSRKRARWMDFSGDLPAGGQAGVAIFVHRDNPHQPPPWCVIQGMPYFNPAFTGSEDYSLAAGKTLTLRYRVLVHPGLMTREQLEAEWKAFAETAVRKTSKAGP